jgi:hypothetical protein
LVCSSTGRRIAHVDGSTVLLDYAPLDIKDVLYAPLRFFTDVLGAQVSFDRTRNTVNIVAQLIGRSAEGIAQDGDLTQRFGTVSAVDVTSDPPTVTLVYNAAVRTISIGANATIDMRDVDANVTVPGELVDVHPGDFARVYTNKAGHVIRVEDDFGSNDGRIAAATATEFVLDDGHVIQPDRTTTILLNGKAAAVGDLHVGDRVAVRYNVESNEIRSVLATRAVADGAAHAAAGPSITSVQLDANRPLRAGDRINVTLAGTAGGSATFDIGSYVTNISMAERAAGTYQGSYQLPAAASFNDVPIIGHLRVAGADAPDVQSAQTLSASGSPPGVADFAPGQGASVNTNRPAIYATFAADAVAVNPSSVVLTVNGRDVTSNSVRTAQFIQYTPAYSYPTGEVHVTVRVADLAGNQTTRSWSFTIRQ